MSANCPDKSPCAALIASSDPVSPAYAALSPVNGVFTGTCAPIGDISAVIMLSAEGRIIYEANRALSPSGMDAFRSVCRSKYGADMSERARTKPARTSPPSAEKQLAPPTGGSSSAPPKSISVPAPVKESASSLPQPQSEALTDILAMAKQLFPPPETSAALPPPEPQNRAHAERNITRGVRHRRVKKSATPKKEQVQEQPVKPRPPLTMPFPAEDVFAAGFSLSPSPSAYTPAKASTPAHASAPMHGYSSPYAHASVPALRGELSPSPFPNTYPELTFYRVPLPFYRQPYDYCFIGCGTKGERVYALPVTDDKKRLPPLLTGAALRRGADMVLYATLRV